MNGYYRIITPLSYAGTILHANTVHLLRLKEDNIAKLVEVGIISPIYTPPVEEIPELKQFAERLNGLGVHTLQQFLETKAEDLKSIWRRSEFVEKHKDTLVKKYLMVEKREEGCGC